MKFTHLSDIHVGGDLDIDWARDYLQRLREASPDDTLLIVTGDITDDGSESQYRDAHDLFMPWEGNILFVPGNHDVAIEGVFSDPHASWRWKTFEGHFRSRFLVGHEGWKERCTFSDDTCRVVYNSDYTVVLVNSVPQNTRPPWAFARGEISENTVEELHRLRRQLERTTSVVALHHHPWSQDWFLQMANAHALTYATYGYADFVLFGHMHRGPRTWHVAFARCQRVKRTQYLFQRNLDWFRENTGEIGCKKFR